MKFIFAIPTWNRAQELLTTIQNIVQAQVAAGVEVLIVVSDNHSTDETCLFLNSLETQFSFIKSIRPETHIKGQENYLYILKYAYSIMSDDDYVWSFGDDDDLARDKLGEIYSIINIKKPYFASVGNTKLPPHTNNCTQLPLSEIANRFGFFLTMGFISQLVFSKRLLHNIIQHDLMQGIFSHDSYSHGSSILLSGVREYGLYIDAPISTFRARPEQIVETNNRWKAEGVYSGIFNFVDSLEILAQHNAIPVKLDRRFFRYWRWHFWDFLIYNATIESLENIQNLNSNNWEQIHKLANFLQDSELAKRLRITIELQRRLIYSCIKSQEPFPITLLQQYEGCHVYMRGLGELD